MTDELEKPALPGPVLVGRPARRLRDAFEPIAMHNIAHRSILERAGVPELDRLAAYVWARAAPMGEPSAEVVVAAFGVFEPGLISAAYERGRAAVPRDVLLAAQEEAIAESLGEVLAGADVLPVVHVLRHGLEAADGTARALFSGLRSLAWPKEPTAQLWRACNMLREHRGDGHLAASIAAGLDPVQMNVMTEVWLGGPLGPYTRTRGWSEPRITAATAALEVRGFVANGAITESGRQFRDDIEAVTDAMQEPIVAAIGSDLEWVTGQLQEWAAACIASGTFTADVFKRAAG